MTAEQWIAAVAANPTTPHPFISPEPGRGKRCRACNKGLKQGWHNDEPLERE